MRDLLVKRLTTLGRLEWLKTETAAWQDDVRASRSRERWWKTSGISGLPGRGLAVVREIWRWREAQAQRREVEAKRRAEIATNETAQARAIQAKAEAQLAAVLGSTTWRATAPLRNMVANTSTLRRALRRYTKGRAKT